MMKRSLFMAVAVVIAAMAEAGLSSRAYVQDGLVVQLDGIENVGRGLAHDSAAAVWKDLTGNGGDGVLQCLSSGQSNCWYDGKYYRVRANEKNWVHGQSSAFQQAINGLTATMDMCYTPASGHTGCWCGKSTRHLCTAAGGNNTLLVYARHGNVLLEGGANMPRPNSANQSFAIRLNTTCTVFTNGVAAMSDRPVTGTSNGAPDYYIGINPQYTSVDDPSGTAYNGTSTYMYSLRLYNRALTDDEIAFNNTIDNIRFRGEALGDRKVLVVGAKPYAFGTSTPAYGSSFVTGSSVEFAMDAGLTRYEDGVEAVPAGEGIRSTFAGAEVQIDDGAATTNKSASFSLDLGTENTVNWLLGAMQYRVIVEATGDVSVSIDGGTSASAVTNWVDAGSVVIVTSASAFGNRFKTWAGDVAGVADPTARTISVTVNGPVSLQPKYDVIYVDPGSESYPTNTNESAAVSVETRVKDSAESGSFWFNTFRRGLNLILR